MPHDYYNLQYTKYYNKSPILSHSAPIYMFGITVTVNNYWPARQGSLMEDTVISVAYEQSFYMLFGSIYVLSVWCNSCMCW
jgi:hypothetical protein